MTKKKKVGRKNRIDQAEDIRRRNGADQAEDIHRRNGADQAEDTRIHPPRRENTEPITPLPPQTIYNSVSFP